MRPLWPVAIAPSGHQITDLAQAIKNDLPNEACKVGRYESDAFLILLPGVESAAARECLLRCHERFVLQPVMHEHLPLRAGFSAGIVEYPRDGLSEDELIQCLDLTIFLTRYEGGNRILSYSDVRNSF